MNSGKNWYAVYTRPKWEKKVAELLNRKNIDNYCPIQKSIRQWSDRKKTILEPLFNSYVFVNVSETDHLRVRETDGILNFVYWLGKPAVVKGTEIEAIRTLLFENQHIRLEKIDVNLQDQVRIIDGPFKHWEGNVTEIRPRSVKVLLPSLGYAMIAEVPKSRIEVLATQTHTPYLQKAI
jgi:transcription antitermination factor NusG